MCIRDRIKIEEFPPALRSFFALQRVRRISGQYEQIALMIGKRTQEGVHGSRAGVAAADFHAVMEMINGRRLLRDGPVAPNKSDYRKFNRQIVVTVLQRVHTLAPP